MHSLSLLLALSPLVDALATPSPYTGLTPRIITLPSGTSATIYENPSLTFHKIREENTHLNKRLQYTTYANPADGRNDYCGEWNTVVTGGESAPLATDCKAIALAYTRSTPLGDNGALGYWVIEAADFAAAPAGYVTLAASGTCKFAVKINSPQPLQRALFGANDLRFYTNSAVGSAVGGRVDATGSVSCFNGTNGFFISTGFRISHV
ncbi:hypothetical protein OQA88_8956 [Cercophora sp. LCS_1]